MEPAAALALLLAQPHTASLSLDVDGSREAALVLAALGTNASLTSLAVRGRRMSEEAGLALARALQENTALRELKLWDSGFGEATGVALAGALRANRSLRTLRVWYGAFGEATGVALAAALKENEALQVLELWNDRMGDGTARALGAALRSNRCLQVLELWLGSARDWTGLAEGLQPNRSLESLTLWATCGAGTGSAIADRLETNPTLCELAVWDEGLSRPAEPPACAGALARNRALAAEWRATALLARKAPAVAAAVAAMTEPAFRRAVFDFIAPVPFKVSSPFSAMASVNWQDRKPSLETAWHADGPVLLCGGCSRDLCAACAEEHPDGGLVA